MLSTDIDFPQQLTRKFIREHKEITFLFGDNLLAWGHGGQAYVCRGEENAIGIPTKRCPKMDEGLSFFSDDLTVITQYQNAILREFKKALDRGQPIYVIPGIGTGLSKMNEKAPLLYNWMKDLFNTCELVINKGKF